MTEQRRVASGLKVPGPLVSVEWLAADLRHPELVVLDASWYLPGSGRSGEDEWLWRRIPGSRYFDFDGPIRDVDSPLPHMLPTAEQFTHEARRLGINQNSAVVVYDGDGIFASARAWWMLRTMGCDNVAVLDGGLPAWLLAEMPVETEAPDTFEAGDFCAQLHTERVSDVAKVQAAMQAEAVSILDARPADRFYGRVAEPRPGLRRGHIPGSCNLPYQSLLDGGHMRSSEDLLRLFQGLAPAADALVLSCGSGVSASVLALGAELAGYRDWSVYDGSWSEWGGLEHLPVE